MVTVSELRARVALDYQRLRLPSWPDPHPDMDPRDEEYSRLTDPGRYRIVHARARVWRAVLEEMLGARSEDVVAGGAVPGLKNVARVVRLVADRPGTLPLLLLEHDIATSPGQATLAGLTIAVGRPDVVVDGQPDCGCDACDSGSSDLLEAIDTTIGQVVGGPFALLRGDGWSAQWHPGGGGASSSEEQGPGLGAAIDWCRRLATGDTVRLPSGTEAFVGGAWTAP